MRHFSKKELENPPSRYRAHLINRGTGFKSAKVRGTSSVNGSTNLAIFNAVVHIGSDPPMLGFILRPLTVKRNTYTNFKSAPYVAESNLKIGSSYVNENELKENGCLLIISAIEHIYLPKEVLHEDGWVQLDKTKTIAAIGLDGYALPNLLNRLAYTKPYEDPKALS